VSSTQNEVFADRQKDFDEVASRYSPVLFRIALRRLRNVEDAEDAVHDAFLSAYTHIGQFEGRSKLSSWLTKIVINTAGMKLRRRPRQQPVSLDQSPEDSREALANQLVGPAPTPEAVCAQAEMEELLRSTLAHIPPKLSLAFQMREVAGFSTREVADALKTTTSAVKSRVKRARAAIGLYLHKVEAVKLTNELKAPVMNRRARRIQNEALIDRTLCCLSRNELLAKPPQISRP
jgi:RNA polymerase sigma-70 factor (ECF subfamily)